MNQVPARIIDINCDMGESLGNWKLGRDEEVITQITTANAACGFHGGDPITMLTTVAMAKQHGVVVGAHPGLPDLLGFGRRVMRITAEDAYAYVMYQVGALQAFLKTHGMNLHHVKPHGALYLMLQDDEELASAVVDAIIQVTESPVVYWPAPLGSSAFARNAGSRGVVVVGEMYPDLEYTSDGALVLQRSKEPVDLQKASAQVERFVEEGYVQAQDGTLVPLEAESICVHGDGPNVVELLQAVRNTLSRCGCAIEAIRPAVEAEIVGSG